MTPEIINHSEDEKKPLEGKTALITGSSRDIGAQIAIELARLGVSIIGNHRDSQKARRAIQVESAVGEVGGDIEFVIADITSSDDRGLLFEKFQSKFGAHTSLDFLVLNASGPTREINVDANNALVDLFLPTMPVGGKIILMQSVPAHFYNEIEDKSLIPEFYKSIAEAKHEGEMTLRARIPEFEQRGVTFIVVCPPEVSDTNNMIFFKRKYPDASKKHAELSNQFGLPQSVIMEQVAKKVAELVTSKNLPQGHVELFR